jgi:hypothetical protein
MQGKVLQRKEKTFAAEQMSSVDRSLPCLLVVVSRISTIDQSIIPFSSGATRRKYASTSV